MRCLSGLEMFCVRVLVRSWLRWRSQGHSEMLVCSTFIDHRDSLLSLSKQNTFTPTHTHCVTSLWGHGRNSDRGMWRTYLSPEVSLENILIASQLIWITLERLGTIHKSLQQTFSKILKTLYSFSGVYLVWKRSGRTYLCPPNITVPILHEKWQIKKLLHQLDVNLHLIFSMVS